MNRHHRRRNRRRRNGGIVRLFNPFPGGNIVGKVTGTLKGLVSKEKVMTGAGITGGILASWYGPQKFVPHRDVGVQGLALSALSGGLASVLVSFVAPRFAGPVAIGAVVGTILKAVFPYSRSLVRYPGTAGIGSFLTLAARGSGVGQIPQALVNGMGDFMESRQQFAAVGPAGARQIAAAAPRFTAFS